MGDGSELRHEWGKWLRRITSRPGWSVAELARRTKEMFGEKDSVSRGTLFVYLREGAESVSIGTVRKLAAAAGEDFKTALLAAGNIPQHAVDDQLSTIVTSGLDEQEQRDLIEYVEAVRQTQRDAMQAEIETRLKRRVA